jgi:ribosome-binding ATPase YchF (GTP1/OBG family)
LKDVAGLVPGAYQGRGRGNKFLNDLTDADVLIHVADASGMADTEGNMVGTEEDGTLSTAASHPLNDLAWIRNELIYWLYANLMFKWDIIRRKGRSKLSGMFSGYGQSQHQTLEIFDAVGKYLEQNEQRERALDNLDQWDEGDVSLNRKPRVESTPKRALTPFSLLTC